MCEAAASVPLTTGQTYVPGASVAILYEEKIAFQPCCLKFSPKFLDCFVVGTYSLEDPTTQLRNGSVLLYRLDDERLTLLDTVICPSGILDIQFINEKNDEVDKFAVASSTGSISIFNFVARAGGVGGRAGVLQNLNTFQIFPESTLITSLAWHSSVGNLIAVSTSEGQMSVLNFHDSFGTLKQPVVVDLHSNNAAWTVAFSVDLKIDAQTGTQLLRQVELEDSDSSFWGVYSGGDDSRLRFAHFSGTNDGHVVLNQPAFSALHGGEKGLGGHNAGVTTILLLPFLTKVGEDILITGSYDDHVRVYAMHDYPGGEGGKESKVLAELNVGGGVWRLTFLEEYDKLSHPLTEGSTPFKGEYIAFKILASCMQGGARIIEVRCSLKNGWSIKVLAELRFNTTNDLVYAGAAQSHHSTLWSCRDWEDPKGEEEFVCVSTNFYEKQLCVWKYYSPAVVSPVSPKTLYIRSRKALDDL